MFQVCSSLIRHVAIPQTWGRFPSLCFLFFFGVPGAGWVVALSKPCRRHRGGGGQGPGHRRGHVFGRGRRHQALEEARAFFGLREALNGMRGRGMEGYGEAYFFARAWNGSTVGHGETIDRPWRCCFET